jgi:hypothetical protein
VSHDTALAAISSPDPQEQKMWCRVLDLVIRSVTRVWGHVQISTELTLSVADAVAFDWCHLCYREPLTIMSEFTSVRKTWVSLAATTCGLENWIQWFGGHVTQPNIVALNPNVRHFCKVPLPNIGVHRWSVVITGRNTICVGVGDKKTQAMRLITQIRECSSLDVEWIAIGLSDGNELGTYTTFHGVTLFAVETNKYPHLLPGSGDVLTFEADMNVRSLSVWRGNAFLIQMDLPVCELYIATGPCLTHFSSHYPGSGSYIIIPHY